MSRADIYIFRKIFVNIEFVFLLCTVLFSARSVLLNPIKIRFAFLKNMFSWLKSPEPKEATWSEINQAFIEYYKCITYSVFDHEEQPVVYTNVPSSPVVEEGFGIDFEPITFLTCYFVQTHKGSPNNNWKNVSFLCGCWSSW